MRDKIARWYVLEKVAHTVIHHGVFAEMACGRMVPSYAGIPAYGRITRTAGDNQKCSECRKKWRKRK